jgi:hypothetical protein
MRASRRICATFRLFAFVANQTVIDSSGGNGSTVRACGRPSASTVMAAQ